MKTVEDCTAVILTGGRSLRMGRDKAEVMVAGTSMLDRCVSAMSRQFRDVVLSVRTPRERLGILQVCDQQGLAPAPMAGILSALEQVDTSWVFAIACDMPFFQPKVIDYMGACRGRGQAVAAIVSGVVQPLAAFYSRSSLPQMRRQMEHGDRSLKRLLNRLDATLIDERQVRDMDPGLVGFADLDSRRDVEKAESTILEGSR